MKREISCARTTRGLRRPSLDARSGRPKTLPRKKASLKAAIILNCFSRGPYPAPP